MKMKKAKSTAAILAVMALTAGFSVSAADVTLTNPKDNVNIPGSTITVNGEQVNVSGDMVLTVSGNAMTSVTNGVVISAVGGNSVTTNNDGTTVTGGLNVVSGLNTDNAEVSDKLNAGSVMTGELDVNAGNTHLFVNEQNGIQLNKGESSLYVHDNGVRIENGLTVDHIGSTSGALMLDSDVLGKNGTFNKVTTDTVDSNNVITGDLTVNNSATVNGQFMASDGGATIEVTDGFAGMSAGNAMSSVVDGVLINQVGNSSMTMTTNGTTISTAGKDQIIVTADGTTLNGTTTTHGDLVVKDGILMADNANLTNASVENLYADKVDANEMTTGKLNVTGDANVEGNFNVNGKFTINNQELATAGNVDEIKNKIGVDAAGNYKAIEVKDQNGNQVSTLTDAVNTNYSQIQQNSQAITSLDSRVSDLDSEIDNVGAISAALAGLHPLDYDGTGSKFQLSAAMGTYDGSQAAAIGAFYHFNRDVMISLGGATAFDGDHKTAGNLGVTFRIGEGASGKAVSDDVMARLEAMDQKIAALEQENKDLKNVLGAIDTSLSKEFPDVPANHWAYEAVSKLAGNDIVAGYPDGEFHGDRTMTRYEMAEIIYKAMNKGVQVDQKLVNEFKPEMEQVAANERA